MIEVFKLREGIENVDYNQFLTLYIAIATNCYALMQRSRQIFEMRSRLDVIESSFSVSEWSTLGIVCGQRWLTS